jgi:hypothetical protein
MTRTFESGSAGGGDGGTGGGGEGTGAGARGERVGEGVIDGDDDGTEPVADGVVDPAAATGPDALPSVGSTACAVQALTTTAPSRARAAW